jgi:hypothetical protein
MFIPPISPQSPSSIIWGWYNRPVVAAVPSGLSLTPLTTTTTTTTIIITDAVIIAHVHVQWTVGRTSEYAAIHKQNMVHPWLWAYRK